VQHHALGGQAGLGGGVRHGVELHVAGPGAGRFRGRRHGRGHRAIPVRVETLDTGAQQEFVAGSLRTQGGQQQKKGKDQGGPGQAESGGHGVTFGEAFRGVYKLRNPNKN
jgi:hypothetical protein